MYKQNQNRQIRPQSRYDYTAEIRQIVQNVSESESYQVKLIVFFMLIAFITNLEVACSHYFYMNPSFYCDGNMEEKVNEVDACNRLQFCNVGRCGNIQLRLRPLLPSCIYTVIRNSTIEFSYSLHHLWAVSSGLFFHFLSVIEKGENSVLFQD